MSVLAELTIFPMDKGVSLSPYVARAATIIRASGLEHSLGPMGTCIEGGYDEVMEVVRGCFTALAVDCERISLSLKIDYRKGTSGRITGKVHSVREKMDRV